MKYQSLFIILAVCCLTACDGFFGKKTDTDFLDVPTYNNNTVAYVPIQPVWDNFQEPVDVIAGWDELVYVADAQSQEIVAFDQAGSEQGRFSVPGLKAITQDRRLDLLALGTKDTTIQGEDFTLDAIYRIDLNPVGPYGIQYASIARIIIHPFYFDASTPSIGEQQVKFTGIAALADNRYYVTRTGPFSSPIRGSDNAVLLFSPEDEFITPIFVTTSLGVETEYFKAPKSITTFSLPPQSPAVNREADFIFASSSPSDFIKVQIIDVTEDDNGTTYTQKDLSAGDTSKADGFLYSPDRFASPTDVTVAGDGTGYIFVVDAETDSLYQFNALGYEGVAPPSGSTATKVIKASFGGTGGSLTQFRNPSGVAYLNQILYIADTGNGRILRFKLTTDFD